MRESPKMAAVNPTSTAKMSRRRLLILAMGGMSAAPMRGVAQTSH